jgi:tRNA (guanosine-2'-O-)-methyltransferase
VTPERITRLRSVLERRQPDLCVVTDFVHKPRNLSALLRTCDAVGIMRLHAVLAASDYRAFRRTAAGSQRWVEVVPYPDAASAVARVRSEGAQVVMTGPGEGARDFRTVDYTRPTALLLGSERSGVSPEGARLAEIGISIPMVGMVESLNVSVAAGIILAEAQRQRQAAGYYDRPRIDARTRERLLFEWGHPAVKDFCDERGLCYPPLDAEGEIERPAEWYAAVRAGTAARREEDLTR